MSDDIDTAITATQGGAPAEDTMQQFAITLERTGGRVVLIALPIDITLDELLELTAYLTTPPGGGVGLRAALGPPPSTVAPRLYVPRQFRT